MKGGHTPIRHVLSKLPVESGSLRFLILTTTVRSPLPDHGIGILMAKSNGRASSRWLLPLHMKKLGMVTAKNDVL
ncbi:MAG: hypothetical protein NPIRA03_06160 [Nitrospirales bacterium]|nr:MAG: hypothetical protein NPIRA03_06160 [Nitrospirales bacterium]